jgi:hypothetical protein
MASVLEHVHEGRTHLARRTEGPCVEAVGEDGTGASPGTIRRSCEPHEEALHAPRERAPIGRLDEEVRVRRLERVVHEPEGLAPACRGESAFDGRARGAFAQVRQPILEPHRDVDGMASRVDGPRGVRHPGSSERRLATGAPPSASPTAEGQVVLTRSSPEAVHAE